MASHGKFVLKKFWYILRLDLCFCKVICFGSWRIGLRLRGQFGYISYLMFSSDKGGIVGIPGVD